MTLSIVASGPATRPGNIPEELKAFDRWVTFAVDGSGVKSRKMPYIGATNEPAKANDPATWISYTAAQQAAEATGRYLGFAFDPTLPYTFLDFDGVLGPKGVIKAYASIVIDTLDTYTEASISGAGVHVICRGRPPAGFTKEGMNGKVEVYPAAGGRFALLTGNTRPGLGNDSAEITDCTDQLRVFFPARPSHELVQTTPNGALTTIPAELTPEEIAALVEAVRAAWTEGQRHFVALSMGGILARNSVPEDQALQIITAVDEAPEWRRPVRDSYRRQAGGGDLAAYQSLRELMPADALERVDSTLARFWEARRPKIITPNRTRKLVAGSVPAGEAAAIDSFPAPPAEVFHGWFGAYLELVKDTTEAPDQFHLAAALTIAGAYAGRNVYTKLASGQIFPNLYTVLTGLSSESKKDTAIKRAWDMALDPTWVRERTNPPYVERSGVASAEAFIKGLSTNSNVIIRMSEFSEVMANARRKGTTTILTMLMKAFDNPPQLSNDSLANPAMALNPYVSILAGTQPDILAQDLTDADISSGFANRILFVPGTGKGPNPWPDDVDERKVHEHWLQLRSKLRTYGHGQHLPVNRTPQVKKLWEEFYMAPRGESPMERTLAQRHQIMALKIALIYAMSDGATAIEFEHLSRAITFIDWMWSCVRPLSGTWAAPKEEKLYERMMKLLTQKPLYRKDIWPKVKRRDCTYNDFSRLIDNMVRQGTLAVNEEGRVGIPDDSSR
ncbi:MAG: DUF3987 domain-containing protein [Thermomicrobiales bacterium]